MIFHTITNQLQSCKDNRDSKSIALNSISYWVGLYNIKQKQYTKIKKKTKVYTILYDLKDIFTNKGISLAVNKSNGIATLEIPQHYR